MYRNIFRYPSRVLFFGCHPNTKKYKSAAFESFAPSHEISGWCDYDVWWIILTKGIFHLLHMQLHTPSIQVKCDNLFQITFSQQCNTIFQWAVTIYDHRIGNPDVKSLYPVRNERQEAQCRLVSYFTDSEL